MTAITAIGMAMYEEMRAEMEANEWGRMVVIEGGLETSSQPYVPFQIGGLLYRK